MHPRREREPLLLARGAGLPTAKERSGLRVCGKVAGSSRPRRRWSSLRALQKCLAPERFACLLVLCPGLQRANRLFSLRPASLPLSTWRRLARRGGAGYVSAPHREGRRISRLCFHERSWPLPVLILPRKLRLVFRPLFAAAEKLARPARPEYPAAEADSRASKKAGKTGFPALFDERRPSAALRSEFSEFRPSLRPRYLPARRDVGLTLRAWCAPRAEASLPEL